MVDSFLKRKYKYTNRSIYWISCFGLTNRKDVLDVIRDTIKESDDSISAMALSILGIIPVIGEPLAGILKKKYSYSSVKKGSIFVFDDFERIASTVIVKDKQNEINTKRQNSQNYKKEQEEIYSVLKDLNSSLSDNNDIMYKTVTKEYENKYLALVSVINDMIERYGHKVIIICNSDLIGRGFLNDVVKAKLNCFFYEKKTSDESAKRLMTNILDNYIIDDEKKIGIYKGLC